MKLSVHELTNDTPGYQFYLNHIIDLSHDSYMIPVTPESIMSHHLGHVAVSNRGDKLPLFAGYAAVTQVYSPEVVEVGSVVVSPDFRGQGVASRLVRTVTAEAISVWPNAQVISFTNDNSRRIFQRMGGVQLKDPAHSLPREVWKLCVNCTSYKERVVEVGEICCGRVVDITNINNQMQSNDSE